MIDYKNKNGFYPTICIELLNWCNLNCMNCRSDSSPRMKDKLDFAVLQNFLTELKKHGNWRISLTGGEPFFYYKINELLNHIANLGFQFSITTNGYKVFDQFSNVSPIIWTNGTLYVSLDGLEDQTDFNRGIGVYKNVIEFIKQARSIVRKINVSTAIYDDPNIWGPILYNVLTELNIDNWTLISPIKDGRYIMPYFSAEIYSKWASKLLCLNNGKTTITFLDFCSSYNRIQEVVFINPIGEVKLLGRKDNENIEKCGKTDLISDPLIIDKIVNSVTNFYSSESYIF